VKNVLILATVAALALTACSGPKTFDAKGTMTIGPKGVTQYAPGGGECKGTSGYDDISAGAQVVVTADGKTVGVGELGEGKYKDGWCEFPFTVSGIKEGNEFYGVEVSHRGKIEYTSDDLKSGVKLSLGS